MDATEFMAALNTVEEDHQLLLEKVQGLKETVSRSFEPGDDSVVQALEHLADLNAYFDAQFEAHMQEEEESLFPFLERHQPEGAAVVTRLRAQHAEIRHRREDLRNCLRVAVDLEDALPRPVLRDVLAYGWELWGYLHDHARLETQAVHQCVTGALLEENVPGRA